MDLNLVLGVAAACLHRKLPLQGCCVSLLLDGVCCCCCCCCPVRRCGGHVLSQHCTRPHTCGWAGSGCVSVAAFKLHGADTHAHSGCLCKPATSCDCKRSPRAGGMLAAGSRCAWMHAERGMQQERCPRVLFNSAQHTCVCVWSAMQMLQCLRGCITLCGCVCCVGGPLLQQWSAALIRLHHLPAVECAVGDTTHTPPHI